MLLTFEYVLVYTDLHRDLLFEKSFTVRLEYRYDCCSLYSSGREVAAQARRILVRYASCPLLFCHVLFNQFHGA
jgi:hypothetical protein